MDYIICTLCNKWPYKWKYIRNWNENNTNDKLLSIWSQNHLICLHCVVHTDSKSPYRGALEKVIDHQNQNQNLKTRSVSFTHAAPWYTPELHLMKTRKSLEWLAKKTWLTVHTLAYKDYIQQYKDALNTARSAHYSIPTPTTPRPASPQSTSSSNPWTILLTPSHLTHVTPFSHSSR